VRAPSGTRAAIEDVARYAELARDAGAEVVVFPEALVGGYPRGARFGAVIGDRSPAGRDEFLAYSRGAVTVPGPEVEELSRIAVTHQLHLVVGLIERAGTSLYCAAVTIDDQGELVSRRRKVMPTGSERLVWAQGDGSTLRVAVTRLGVLATAICWENLMPALRMTFYAQGAELWCAPTADARDVQLATMRHIAIEGRCFVLCANQFAQARDLSSELATSLADPEAVVCRGASVIVDPFGEVLAGPLTDGEGLLVAEIDLDEVMRARFDFDAVGHYSRPDIFSLRVDTRVKEPVSWDARDDGIGDAPQAGAQASLHKDD
jgi:nitrilase